MANNLLKPSIHFGMLMLILLSVNSHAGNEAQVITNVLEEVRMINISSTSNSSSAKYKKPEGPTIPASSLSLGTVAYDYPDCTRCTKSQLNYGQSTKLINPFGSEKPIKELESWRGSRAQITYRMVDNHILEIKILP